MTMQYRWNLGGTLYGDWVDVLPGATQPRPPGYIQFREKPEEWEENHCYFSTKSATPVFIERVFADGSALGWMWGHAGCREAFIAETGDRANYRDEEDE